MQATREAIENLFKDDWTFEELSPGGLHFEAARPTAKFPFTIFFQAGDRIGYTFADDYQTEIWCIKGVGEGEEGRLQAEKIDEYVQAKMYDAALAISPFTLNYCRRDENRSGVSYREPYAKAFIYHVGKFYRLEFE